MSERGRLEDERAAAPRCSPLVVWHDVECGRYSADLALWHELAHAGGGRVLDVGAGTGRVALALARAGHDVTALDHDPDLLAALTERAGELAIDTVVADAAGFDAGRAAFGLVAVPMQTIQLLPDRAGFFASARRAVAPGGLVALAIATDLEPFDGAELPPPDAAEHDGTRYLSQPTAVRAVPGGTRIERLRHTIPPGTAEQDVIVLAAVSADELAAEGAAAGLEPDGSRHIAATAEHVGSEVVMLRG
jgi:SAM-dependent methyltransferase